jgi:HPt (histidine-containing phosphotransfer) domain-containing protein
MSSIIDIGTLEHRCMGQQTIVLRVLGRFRDTMPPQVLEMRRMVHDGNLSPLADMAHGIKGAAASIAAERLRAAAEELETRAKLGCRDDIQTALHVLDEELDACIHCISNLVIGEPMGENKGTLK